MLSLAALSFDNKYLRVCGDPLHMVLFVPLNEIYALEHIGDVVNAAFLNLKLLHGLIQVKLLVWLRPEQMDEFIRQLDQAIFLACAQVLHGEGAERRGLGLNCFG